jgi:hypothetical protein
VGHRESKLTVVLSRAVHPVVLLCTGLAICWTPIAHGDATIDELAETYEFLVSRGGALYAPTAGPLRDVILPLSFNDSPEYWGEYVCRLPHTNCAVTDYYDPSDYAVKARAGEGAQLQTERVNVHNGTNIYDAATWQIAVVLGATVNKFGNFLDTSPYELATNQNRVLAGIRSTPNMTLGSRATTRGELYRYNGRSVSDPKAAYAFRMTAATWLADDPLRGTPYASLLTVGALPHDNPDASLLTVGAPHNPAYVAGRIAWSDWKPITGDNAWAYLVGPLQTQTCP